MAEDGWAEVSADLGWETNADWFLAPNGDASKLGVESSAEESSSGTGSDDESGESGSEESDDSDTSDSEESGSSESSEDSDEESHAVKRSHSSGASTMPAGGAAWWNALGAPIPAPHRTNRVDMRMPRQASHFPSPSTIHVSSGEPSGVSGTSSDVSGVAQVEAALNAQTRRLEAVERAFSSSVDAMVAADVAAGRRPPGELPSVPPWLGDAPPQGAGVQDEAEDPDVSNMSFFEQVSFFDQAKKFKQTLNKVTLPALDLEVEHAWLREQIQKESEKCNKVKKKLLKKAGRDPKKEAETAQLLGLQQKIAPLNVGGKLVEQVAFKDKEGNELRPDGTRKHRPLRKGEQPEPEEEPTAAEQPPSKPVSQRSIAGSVPSDPALASRGGTGSPPMSPGGGGAAGPPGSHRGEAGVSQRGEAAGVSSRAGSLPEQKKTTAAAAPAKFKVYDVVAALNELERWPDKKAGYRQLLFFLFFFCLYLGIQILQLDPWTSFKVNQSMQDVVEGYADIQTQTDLVGFLEGLLINVFEAEYYNGDPFTSSETSYVKYYNKVVGGVLLWQERGRDVPCPKGLYTTFYGPCHTLLKDTSPFGPEENRTKYQYDELQSGHTIIFSVADNRQEVLTSLNSLVTNRWFDRNTRKIRIKFAAYNGEFETFVFVVLSFEFGLAGVMTGRTTATIQSARFELYKKPLDYVRMFLELVLVYLVAFNVADEMIDMFETIKEGGVGAYLKSIWNWLDWANIILIFTYIFLRVKYVRFIFDNPIQLPSNKYEDALEEAAGIQEFLLLINGLNIFEKQLHLFKFFEFQDRMNILNKTMAFAMGDLAHFMTLFFLIFIAYAVVGILIFGPHLETFSSVGRSLQSLGEIMLGEFDFEAIFNVEPFTASLLFWSFILLVFFILVNIFLAILIDAPSYAVAKGTSMDTRGVTDDVATAWRRIKAYGISSSPHYNARKDPLLKAFRFFKERGLEHASEDDIMWYAKQLGATREKDKDRLRDQLRALPGQKLQGNVEVRVSALLKKSWDKYGGSWMCLYRPGPDIDGSGHLDHTEFFALLDDLPIKIDSDDYDKILEVADASGDGHVDFEEFVPVFHAFMLGQLSAKT